ncbi:hypothetical protein WEI85_06560 [Actinomycetes bacterium KLBMP 9797]
MRMPQAAPANGRRQVRALAEECPAHRARIPGTHCCAEIGMGRTRRYSDRRRPYAELHAEYAR